jgi:hypothetical protein
MSTPNRTAGTLYLKTASEMLFNYYPDMKREKRNCLLETADYDRLEGFVEAEEYLMVTAEALSTTLWNYGICLPDNLTEAVLFSTDPDEDLKEALCLCKAYHFNNGEKGQIAYAVIKEVHNLWVWNFQDHFFIKQFESGVYRFMPLELVGYKRCEYYYNTFLKPLFTALGLKADGTYVWRAYTTAQDIFLVDNKIRDKATLSDAIFNIDEPITPGIKHALEHNSDALARVLKQVIEHNPVLRR